jgi:hypothetical protein
MTDYQAYLLYVSLKNHFTQVSYDYFKYQGKVKTTFEQFEKRSDRYFFAKLAKHDDPQGFLIANFIENNNFWIGELSQNQQSTEIYLNWKKRNQSFNYIFTEQVKQLIDCGPVESWFKVLPNTHPPLITLLVGKQLAPEVFIVLVDIVGCYSYWNRQLKSDVVWEQVSKLYVKYKPFLIYDRKQCKQTLKQMVAAPADVQLPIG